MLDKRLQACVDLIPQGSVVCDVGTDHAYLVAELLESGRCQRAIATDISDGPLLAARRTLEQRGLWKKASLLLTDGLWDVPPQGITHIVIAGMGGESIVHILRECQWIRDPQRTLILQPMSKEPILRSWLAEQGFDSMPETVLGVRNRIYHVLSARFSGNPRKLSFLEEEFGRVDWKDPVVQREAKAKYRRYITITLQLQDAKRFDEGQVYRAKADAITEQLKKVEEETAK